MGTQQKSLVIVFRCIQPETLYQGILQENGLSRTGEAISSARIAPELFYRVAHSQYSNFSYEEIQNIHAMMEEQMKQADSEGGAEPSVFHLLTRMGKRVLRQERDLVCDFSQLFAWRSVYQELGQDIFTTAFLAAEDLRYGQLERTDFAWEAILKTDNVRLNALLRQGIAENHCHLGGTSQIFPLSWACMMNYPDTIRQAEKWIGQNLQANYSRGVSGNVWPWEKRLLWAAFLRLELFRELEREEGTEREKRFWMEKEHFYPRQYVKRRLELLRFQYGAAVGRNPPFVPDYALRGCDCGEGLLDKPNRLLSGERSFLYRCFRACFDGTFSRTVQTWFYLYLLIKENFRAEIVQVNRQAGFRNFKDYQDRKDVIYDGILGYQEEALLLAVNENQKSQNILSFEARIAPKPRAWDMYRKLLQNREKLKGTGGLRQSCHFFYVYHFIKLPDPPVDLDRYPVRPRNAGVRTECGRQARAVAEMLYRFPDSCDFVYGIDAANIEIGCRPETFATEFRFLRDLRPRRMRWGPLARSVAPHLRVTYHAGEDFLDIADGLRAIDETVRFLCLCRGDRIGHALALGIEPEIHYAFKGRRIVLPKQDLLDNIVWLLYRSEELDIDINPKLSSQLRTQAESLLSKVYREHIRFPQEYVSLNDYYCSMKLRGDAPELYFTLPYQSPDPLRNGSYDSYQENPAEELREYRNSAVISGLCQHYHYNQKVRCAGRAVSEYHISDAYIALIRAMQERLADELGRRGIMVECNPTSNFLIGTFRRYEAHPIFRFNNVELLRADGTFIPSHQLSVSINTDDAGVFDTSLENEYALLSAALECARTEDGKPKYTSDSIYKYLENVRRMGLEQSFYFAEEKVSFPENPNEPGAADASLWRETDACQTPVLTNRAKDRSLFRSSDNGTKV